MNVNNRQSYLINSVFFVMGIVYFGNDPDTTKIALVAIIGLMGYLLVK